jgi:hypothetical protein
MNEFIKYKMNIQDKSLKDFVRFKNISIFVLIRNREKLRENLRKLADIHKIDYVVKWLQNGEIFSFIIGVRLCQKE